MWASAHSLPTSVLNLLRLWWKHQTMLCAHHVRGDFLGSVAIQIKLEGHHFVVVGLQLTLNHLVSGVTHLRAQRDTTRGEHARNGQEEQRGVANGRRTLSMLSLGLLLFSWRERVRADLRWCFRGFPSAFPPLARLS